MPVFVDDTFRVKFAMVRFGTRHASLDALAMPILERVEHI